MVLPLRVQDDLQLHVHTINGAYIASKEAGGRLTAMTVTRDGRIVITGGGRYVTVRSMHKSAPCTSRKGGGEREKGVEGAAGGHGRHTPSTFEK